MIKTNFTLDVAFEELTKEIDVAIGREVSLLMGMLGNLYGGLWDTGHFFRSWKAPHKIGEYNWNIRNTADYAPVLSRGRKTINGKAYGSLKWYNGLNPMLDKLEADIINATDKIKV